MIKKEKGVSIGRLTPQIRQCGQPEWLVWDKSTPGYRLAA